MIELLKINPKMDIFILPEIRYEISKYLGNTDRRRFNQTNKNMKMNFKNIETKYQMLGGNKNYNQYKVELCMDGYHLVPNINDIDLYIIYERLDLIKQLNFNPLCNYVAYYGKLEILKYAHEKYCWDEWTCHEAARNGHLDCLKYAHENGCPVGDVAMTP